MVKPRERFEELIARVNGEPSPYRERMAAARKLIREQALELNRDRRGDLIWREEIQAQFRPQEVDMDPHGFQSNARPFSPERIFMSQEQLDDLVTCLALKKQ